MAIDTPTPAQQLEPCPFCGGINTEVREKTMWTGMRSQLINVEVHHWCDVKCGASRGHIELAAPTRDEAIAAWNQRTPNTRALAALEAVEWRPIETAPKDGTMFLGWVSAERWSQEDGGGSGRSADTSEVDFCQWRGNDGNGYFDNMMGQIGDMQDITHWMPLPAPPADAVEVK